MPKSTQKRKTASNKKQPSRVKRTLSWFKPKTPAKSMLLFALMFGVAGGGYYTYRSFAAISDPLIYTFSTRTLDKISSASYSVWADGTHKSSITAATYNQDTQIGGGKTQPSYSSNRKFIAWATVKVIDATNYETQDFIQVRNIATKASYRYTLPNNVKVGGPIRWIPGTNRLVIQTNSDNTFTSTSDFYMLDISTKQFTKLNSTPVKASNENISSYDVLDDGMNLIYVKYNYTPSAPENSNYTNTFYRLATTALNSQTAIYTTNPSNEICSNIRSRTKYIRQFSYTCNAHTRTSETEFTNTNNIYLHSLDSSNVPKMLAIYNQKFTNSSGGGQSLSYLAPSWSPDGSKIAAVVFDLIQTPAENSGCRIYESSRLITIDATSDSPMPTTHSSLTDSQAADTICGGKGGFNFEPIQPIGGSSTAWSPDGQYIAFATSKPSLNSSTTYAAYDALVGRVSTTNPSDKKIISTKPSIISDTTTGKIFWRHASNVTW